MTHTHTYPVRFLWTWDRPFAENYLTTHSTHIRQISMSSGGFKLAIPASEQLRTHALDRAVTGFFFWTSYVLKLAFW